MIFTYFTHIPASYTVIDDFTNKVTRRTSNINLNVLMLLYSTFMENIKPY